VVVGEEELSYKQTTVNSTTIIYVSQNGNLYIL